MSCKHKWTVLVEKTLPAAFDLDSAKIQRASGLDWRVLLKTHIVILACEKCGQLDKTKTVDGGV